MDRLGDLRESASQTAGPYVHIGCVPRFAGLDGMYGGADLGAEMITGPASGQRIAVSGRVFDGTGTALRDAMLEIWQADAAGLFPAPGETRGRADPHFTGWGRQATDGGDGGYRFDTIKPGQVPWRDGRLQAPHMLLWIVARGINLGLLTRIYFEDEAAANAGDPILTRLEHQNRIGTLLARVDGARTNGEDNAYRFDIHLQGAQETVFFDV